MPTPAPASGSPLESPPSRPLRVLFIAPVTRIGGEELSTLAMARGLVEDGHEAGLGSEGGDLVSDFTRCGVKFHELPLWIRSPGRAWRASRALRAVIEEFDYDIVHSQQVLTTLVADLARRVPSRRPVRVVYHYRGVRPRFMPVVAQVLPRISDTIVTNAEANREAFLARGVSPRSVRTVYNGFDWGPFDEPHDREAIRREWGVSPDAPVVGVIGRLHQVKGHRHFLAAARRVVDSLPDARFVVVGDGPLRGELEEEAGRLDLSDHVRFRGFERDIPRVLAGLDLVALPSIEEAIGRVLVEAHAVGLPAVASRVGGTGEVVEDSVSGYLVPPGQPGPLADRMLELLQNPERARAMGQAGRDRVRRLFGIEVMMRDIEDVYRQVLTDRP